ncbi:MAG: beta-N-acetylglucosaminidase domain-containing protein [Candidatus Lambdaproteobacteria bacterium]|nr:beta-N-acetylglucosaminidase domain-containing protein [Candidatus Lambdaproteobacteria bacterium]
MTERDTARFQFTGVVEGFYGPLWAPAARLRFIDDLRRFGLDAYLYAPKHDPLLAKALLEPLLGADAERLRDLAHACAARGIRLLAGLHLEQPFDPTRDAHLEAVAGKCRALAGLGLGGCAILFDDVPTSAVAPGGTRFGGSLARAQAHAVTEIRRRVEPAPGGLLWWVCPSLYSLDPMVARQWGPFEPGYLATLHAGLPPDVAWFWTGPSVCSQTITLADLAAWRGQGTTAAERPLLLWDNYPVNDAAMVNDLHLGPLSGRAADLPRAIRGYLLNPMLQPALGAIPAATCLQYAADPAGYRPREAWRRALEALLPPDARVPFAALEALTRRSCLAPPAEPLAPAPVEGLIARLAAAWQGAQGEGSLPASLVREYADLLATLDATLPPEMFCEAEPWLLRLRQARALFGSYVAEGDLRAREPLLVAWHAEHPRVLEPWFKP